jgi:hypothetical protein
MSPGLRKFALTVHITSSVGWIGAVIAYLVLDLTVVTSQDAQTVRTAYVAMDLIVSKAVVPLALAALLTGLVISLGTRWGLLRHYWVLFSLLLTILAVVVLLIETQTISRLADIATNPATSNDDLRELPGTLVHSVGGTVILLVIQALNIYKPRGLTPYGWRKQREQHMMRRTEDAAT